MRVLNVFSMVLVMAAACSSPVAPEPPPSKPVVVAPVQYEFFIVVEDMVFPRGLLTITKDSVTNVRNDTTVSGAVRFSPDGLISFILDGSAFVGRHDGTGYIFGAYSNGMVSGRWMARKVNLVVTVKV